MILVRAGQGVQLLRELGQLPFERLELAVAVLGQLLHFLFNALDLCLRLLFALRGRINEALLRLHLRTQSRQLRLCLCVRALFQLLLRECQLVGLELHRALQLARLLRLLGAVLHRGRQARELGLVGRQLRLRFVQLLQRQQNVGATRGRAARDGTRRLVHVALQRHGPQLALECHALGSILICDPAPPTPPTPPTPPSHPYRIPLPPPKKSAPPKSVV